jgi:hypothetical protein
MMYKVGIPTIVQLQVHVRWVTGVPAAVSNDDDKVADKDDEKDEKGEKHKGGDKEVSADSSDHGGSAGDVSPYVTIAVGPAVGITSVAKKSQQAAWRETFFLNVRCFTIMGRRGGRELHLDRKP